MPTRTVEYGVFLPVSSGGWIPSTTTPELDGSYAYNLEVTRLAERLGFDFTLSQAVWRGYAGPSHHFEVNLESLTTTAGLAAATERIGVWSTCNTATFHPAVLAKMIATADQISGGRTGLNIVAGGNRASETQMGLGASLSNPDKYRRAREWVTVCKLLWTEDGVDFDGEFFTLKDCQSKPKPAAGPPPMICAAVSDIGLRFTAEMLDGCLFEGTSRESMIEVGTRAKRIAEEVGSPLKTYCVFMVIPGETDADAQRRLDLYNAGRDTETMARMFAEHGNAAWDKAEFEARRAEWEKTTAVSTGTLCGSADTIAEQLADIIEAGRIDGAVFIMPDFIGDLAALGEAILPQLARHGLPGAALALD
ncbi:LLM class flavin-dependent oxidoreductase [Phytohabitans sp. ZYX-F-186]|uniref:LLM class flavin-dependent oxidoreductase n=1 Tax=Phytohabitans maris TaxID=3071409 RepID=A0ABU0ZTK8_9ACTN|nr:LLM class flavin-dependent oxidoreductase [Phytohabitans sp. ZYX-F-186]MDQ7910379.1 LLM class flavin-dependent oxidoreductase [Phytohabitans sp. ZYX-F-186]